MEGKLWARVFQNIEELRCAVVVRKNSIRVLLGVNVSKSRLVTMLQAHPLAIHFKRILDFGERQEHPEDI